MKYIIFIRRICIAIFSVSVTDNNNDYKIIFILMISLFQIAQNQCEPFIIHSANVMESILLLCFIIVIMLDSVLYISDTFKKGLISFFIVFPFILFIYFIIVYLRSKSTVNINNPLNIFKQRMKYLIIWMIHYYSNNRNKIKNDDDDDSVDLALDLDLKTNVMHIKMTKIQSDPHWMNQDDKK